MNTRRFLSLFGLPLQSTLSLRFNKEGEDAGGGGAASPPKEPEEKGDFVRVPRADYDKFVKQGSELETARKDSASLTTLRSSLQTVLRSDIDPSEKREGMQTLLQDAGYSAAQIKQYLDSQFSETEEEIEEERPAPRRGREKEDPYSKDIEELKRKNQELENHVRESKLRDLNDTLDRAVASSLGAADGLASLTKPLNEALSRLEGDEKEEMQGTLDALRQEFREAIITAVRAKQQATGRFDPSWFASEAATVSKAIAKKWRPLVIPAASRIGRTGETEDGLDRLLQDKPKEAPKHKPGRSIGDIEKDLQDWGTDALLRGLASGGGKV